MNIASVYDAKRFYRELRKSVLNWWRLRRPIEWTASQHIDNPTVNLQTMREHALAELAAQIEKKILDDNFPPGVEP